MPHRNKGRKLTSRADLTANEGIVPRWMVTVPKLRTAQEVHDQKAWLAELYSDAVIQNILDAAKVLKGVSATRLRKCLIEWGCLYSDRKDDRHERASFAPDKRQLALIASYADKLELALANLSDVSAISLWHPMHHLNMLTKPMDVKSHVTDFGLSIHKYERGDGSFEIRHLRPHQIEEAVHVIRRLAEDAAASLPKQSGGQPQFGARLLWIISARNFWHHYSRTAFDSRKTALDFCYAALSRLDSTITPQQVASSMRAANKKPVPEKRRRTSPIKARTRTSKK